jgi:hypothetical protein
MWLLAGPSPFRAATANILHPLVRVLKRPEIVPRHGFGSFFWRPNGSTLQGQADSVFAWNGTGLNDSAVIVRFASNAEIPKYRPNREPSQVARHWMLSDIIKRHVLVLKRRSSRQVISSRTIGPRFHCLSRTCLITGNHWLSRLGC